MKVKYWHRNTDTVGDYWWFKLYLQHQQQLHELGV